MFPWSPVVKGRMGQGATLDLKTSFHPGEQPGRMHLVVTGRSRPHPTAGIVTLDVQAAPLLAAARASLPCAPDMDHALQTDITESEGAVHVRLDSGIDPAFWLDVTIPKELFEIRRGG